MGKLLTKEEVQEKINLTPKQERAFVSLQKAVARCKKEKIYWYQVLESIYALNGHNVIATEDVIDRPEKWKRYCAGGEPTCLQFLNFPGIILAYDVWADDTHFVKLETENH